MNFLAHIYLSPQTDDEILGSVLGDFVKGPLNAPQLRLEFGAGVLRGIALHRRIDAFTDRHPAVRASMARVSDRRRRYAGVMIDLFYDHFLASLWHDFHDQPLAHFSARVYRLLDQNRHSFPDRLQRMLPIMIAEDWLGSYRKPAAVARALDRIAKRFPGNCPLSGAAEELQIHNRDFAADFRRFMPDVMAYARTANAMLAMPDQRAEGNLASRAFNS